MLHALQPVDPGGGEGFTMDGDRIRQFHEGVATRLCEPHSRGERHGPTVDLHLGETQPSRNLQQHVYDIRFSVPLLEPQLPTESPP